MIQLLVYLSKVCAKLHHPSKMTQVTPLVIIATVSLGWVVLMISDPIAASDITWKNEEHQKFSVLHRIVGGNWAKKGAYPFQAAIWYNVTGNVSAFFCGGSLIDSTYVLTAAHCLHPKSMGKLKPVLVFLKTTTLKPPDSNFINVSVARYVYHENFDPSTLENDIGILVLSQPVNEIKPVNLPSKNEDYTGKIATILGWGRTGQVVSSNSTRGAVSNKLLFTNSTIISNADCNKAYNNTPIVKITDKQLCLSTSMQKDSCQGDSGGPLLTGKPRYQIGIVSYGIGCADPRYPGVYTRVSQYLDWINNQTKSFE